MKAEGYSMNALVLWEDSLGIKVELSDKGINLINFGEVRSGNISVIHYQFNWL